MTTETTTVIRQALIDSIESLKTEDFSVCSGFKTDIYLDPETERIYTFVGSNSTPMSAYHNIDRHILRVGDGAISASVYNAIKDVEDDLHDLLDLYNGSEWNGSNHIGQWSEKATELNLRIDDKLFQAEIASYWDAGDWFSPIAGDLKAEWESGKTAEQIIDEQGCGDEIDGMCDQNEAIDWLEGRIEEWQTEAEEEVDED